MLEIHRLLRFSCATALCVFLVSAAWAQEFCPVPTAEDFRVLDLINAERAAAGLAPVALDGRLMESAVRHSEDMLVGCFLSHAGSDGSTKNQRMSEAGYPDPGNEAVGAGQRTTDHIVSAWMASSAHRSILLDPRHTHVGLALSEGSIRCEVSPYGVSIHPAFWTADFGRTTGAAMPPGECDVPAPECSDGHDNDLDGLTDYPQDPECLSPSHGTEGVICGLGMELALLLPSFMWARRRRLSRGCAG